MTLVVLADLHANYAATEAAVHRIHSLSPDGVILLGDYLTDCPHPRRTLDLIYGLREHYPLYMVRGNREDYLLSHRRSLKNGHDDGWTNDSATGVQLYTYNRLTNEDLDFLDGLPHTLDISLPGCPVITACHGSPFKTKDWIIGNDEKIRTSMKYTAGQLILCGHAHRSVRYDRFGKTLLICPSLGLPQDENDDSNLTVLRFDGRKWIRDLSEECTHVAYDLPAFLRDYEESELPDIAPTWSRCVMASLRDRKDYPAQCAAIAFRNAARDGIRTSPPESYWQEAARQIGLK